MKDQRNLVFLIPLTGGKKGGEGRKKEGKEEKVGRDACISPPTFSPAHTNGIRGQGRGPGRQWDWSEETKLTSHGEKRQDKKQEPNLILKISWGSLSPHP